MAGRPRKPTARKIIEGTFRKDRAIENEVKPELKTPDMPEWLGETAKKVWDELAPMFFRLGVLTEMDGYALAITCQQLGRYIDSEIVLNKKGIGSTIHKQEKSGNVSVSPLVYVSNGALKNAFPLMTAFGMTPKDRTRVAQELKQSREKEMSRWEKINQQKNE